MQEEPDLPVRKALPELLAALDHGNAVLVAPPGAGKTTLVPPALLDAPWRGDGTILMLEPRRVAARAAARRMAALRNEAVGGTIGYRTRTDSATSAATRVEVVTEGLLVRRLQSDPGLEDVAAVILDEVHERNLDGDLALALCRDLQRELRPELRLLAMSATVDGAAFARLLDARVIESAGRAHAVSVRHAARDLNDPRDLPAAMAGAIRQALTEEAGDILAFLPGMGEIRRAEAALADCGALVLPLHGDLNPAAQDRALTQVAGRKVVLATSIAETSLTVPGVRVVVDGGFRRTPRLDPGTGLSRLATLRISRAAADQRAGRAGREAPGVAIRLWTAALHRGLPAFERPEMLEAELSALVLDCAAWGARPEELPFLDPPPTGGLAAARALLADLGALNDAGRISDSGRAMARLGAHPRLAAMMLSARGPAESALAADIAALLEERDIFRGPEPPADLRERLAALRHGDALADRAGLGRVREQARQYRRRLGVTATVAPDGDPGIMLAAAFPDRLAQRRDEAGNFRLAAGGGARLPPADPLAREKLLAVAALDLGRSGAARIRLAAPLDAASLAAALPERIRESDETSADPATGALVTRRRRRFGRLVLEDRLLPTDAAAVAGALAAAAGADLALLDWTAAARQLCVRVDTMRRLEPDGGWPDFSDAALAATTGDWLAPHCAGLLRPGDLRRLDLALIVRGMLPWEQARRLDAALPTHLDLPGGRAAVDYLQPVPQAQARAQAFYGLSSTPTLAEGRVPLRLALLSPAGRPIAVTADLESFWRTGWADARKDMRGRYPRHDWPEDPASAAPGQRQTVMR